MNLRSIDLNLLTVLDALLDEAHVSRAAVRLNMSQPAVSNALQRCRVLFGDPLLERGRGTMYRTQKADALREPLKSLLANVVGLIDPPDVDLKTLDQIIRITAADDPISLLVGPLIAALRDTAPEIKIVFQPWHGADASSEQLANGDIDLAISVFETSVEDFEIHTLIEENYVVSMRRGHPAAQLFNLDAWLKWPHVIVSGRGDLRSPLDAKLKSIGLSRKVGVVVPSFQMVPRTLASSDCLAMIPQHSLALQDQTDLIHFKPPISIDGFPLHLAWHVRRSKDVGLLHVAETIKSIFKMLS